MTRGLVRTSSKQPPRKGNKGRKVKNNKIVALADPASREINNQLAGATPVPNYLGCLMSGTSKNTFLRSVRDGVFPDVELRDRRGRRLFSNDDLERLKCELNRIAKTTSVAQDARQ
jgi:hypothetical protein